MKTTTILLLLFFGFCITIVGAILKIEGSQWSSTLLWIGLGIQLALVSILIMTKLKRSGPTQ
jgi:hypothetical protein